MYGWKTYINKFKKAEVVDNKEKYSFGLSYLYLIRMILFFCALLILGGTALADSLKNHYTVKMFLSVILIIYAAVSLFRILSYRVILNKNILKYGKYKLDLGEIESATLKIGRISPSRVGRALEIITNSKKEYILNININNSINFLKILEKRSGKKILINEED